MKIKWKILDSRKIKTLLGINDQQTQEDCLTSIEWAIEEKDPYGKLKF